VDPDRGPSAGTPYQKPLIADLSYQFYIASAFAYISSKKRRFFPAYISGFIVASLPAYITGCIDASVPAYIIAYINASVPRNPKQGTRNR
jgi:hypothetical protein